MITAKSGQTPVADKYRAYVLAGLDQLQTEVTTAGGIEAYIQGSVPGAKTAQITWNGEFLEVSTATYPFEVVKIPAIVVPEAALTTEVGPIQLTEWWCRQPEVLTAGCDTMQAEDPDSVQALREVWLHFLYPGDEGLELEQNAVSLLSHGQMPINIELDAVGITPRALFGLQFTEQPDVALEIAKTIVSYYLIQKKAPCPAPSPEQEELILEWVLADDSELREAYLAAKEADALASQHRTPPDQAWP